MRPGRRRRRYSGEIPNYINGKWTGKDVWTTGTGEPSAARMVAIRMGYDWEGYQKVVDLLGIDEDGQ